MLDDLLLTTVFKVKSNFLIATIFMYGNLYLTNTRPLIEKVLRR